MTHVWQHQSGESVIGRGLVERTYTYEVVCGRDLLDFNLEQQGQIVMDYFFRLNGIKTRSYGSQSHLDIPMGFYFTVLMNLLQFPEYLKVQNEEVFSDDDEF